LVLDERAAPATPCTRMALARITNRTELIFAITTALSVIALMWSCWPDDYQLRVVSDALPPVVRAAAGCWRFEKGATHLDDRLPIGSVVQLDSAPDRRWETATLREFELHVVPLDSADTRSVRASGWGASAGDDKQIIMFLGDGFTGVALRLTLHDSLLSGTARGYADAFPNFSFRYLVGARRVACPARNAA